MWILSCGSLKICKEDYPDLKEKQRWRIDDKIISIHILDFFFNHLHYRFFLVRLAALSCLSCILRQLAHAYREHTLIDYQLKDALEKLVSLFVNPLQLVNIDNYLFTPLPFNNLNVYM